MKQRLFTLAFLTLAMGTICGAQQPGDGVDALFAANRGGKIRLANLKTSLGQPPTHFWFGPARSESILSARSGRVPYEDSRYEPRLTYKHYLPSFSDSSAASPLYWYSHMPAYVSVDRLKSQMGSTYDWGRGEFYAYRPHHFTEFDQGRIDKVADRMDEAFRDRDFSRMAWLIADGPVQVQVGDDTYSIGGADLRAMLDDLVGSTRTTAFRITNVRTWYGGASVVAEHAYVDPWGNKDVVEQRYGLLKYPDGYRLVSFQTNHD